MSGEWVHADWICTMNSSLIIPSLGGGAERYTKFKPTGVGPSASLRITELLNAQELAWQQAII